jgi:hypothetical protein
MCLTEERCSEANSVYYIHEIHLVLRVARVCPALQAHKVLLDTPSAHEAVEERDGARLVVRPRRARAAERLLSDDRTRALLVVVHVPRGVAERRRRVHERSAVGREAVRCQLLVGGRGSEAHMAPVRA